MHASGQASFGTAVADAAPLLSESFDAQGESEVLVADAAEADAAAEAQDAPASPQAAEHHEATVGDEMHASGQASFGTAVADAAPLLSESFDAQGESEVLVADARRG